MTITIKPDTFKWLLDSVRHSLSQDTARPELSYIKLIAKGGVLTAVALDGYVLTKFSCHIDSEDELVAYIKPIPFRPGKNISRYDDVIISVIDNKTSVRVITPFGSITYDFNPPSRIPDINYDKLLDDAREQADRLITVDPIKMIQTSRVFNANARQMDCYYGEKSTSPIFFSTTKDDVTIDHILLPIRRG